MPEPLTEQPENALPQLGAFIQSNRHLRAVMLECKPELRRDFYAALLPHIDKERFNPLPLWMLTK